MPELKQNFSKAKMNKDMDERLVPLGQYREALNIQIATSDGSNVGAAQTLMGNTQHNTMRATSGVYSVPDTSTVVGSIASPARDKIYYFVHNGATAIKKDYIIEYDAVSETTKYVFVDIYEVNTTTSDAEGSPQAWINVDAPSTTNTTGIRIGMTVAGTIDGVTYSHADNLKVSNIVFHDTADDNWKIYLEKDGIAFNDASGAGVTLQFRAPRVLYWDPNRFVTGINILDDTIFWTDNYSEPKRINIPRAIAGTGGTKYLKGTTNAGYLSGVNTAVTSVPFSGDTDYFHTRLTLPRTFQPADFTLVGDLQVITRADKRRAVYVDESHLTVIRRAPTQPLDLEMYRSAVPRVNNSGEETPLFTSHSNLSFFVGTNQLVAGDELSNLTFNSDVDFRVGDNVVLVRTNATDEGNTDFETFDARGTIVASDVTSANALSSTGFGLKLTYIRSGLSTSDTSWYIRLDAGDEFFKFKFPRFSYRYKYQDGEYSTFAPWSKIAFLPDYYEFLPKKGYNLGMVNQLRSLKIKGYVPQELNLPRDVVAIDILYKETNNPTVSIVKTITKFDDTPMWPDTSIDSDARGEYELITDMIHAVVPSNQLLRPWDNVPRIAAAQEISANRLIYGNYLQNFDVTRDPTISVSYASGDLASNKGYALPSVKSQRIYQLGVVFSDRYGRETPVISSEKASVEIPKTASVTSNSIVARILPKNFEIPSWAEYYSFYIKEPTVEYYNASMDRWYAAEDGNIWLSFPSSERNKFDEETFIGLKKQHGTDNDAAGLDRRYKVLAIENEAPDDIKIRKKPIGILYNGTSYEEFVIGNSTNGWPQVGATFITVDTGAFEEAFGDLVTFTPDSMDLKFYGGWQGNSQSAKYEILQISGGGDENHVKLKIKGAFGPDVEWIAGSTQQYDMTVSNLSMRVFVNEIENRPEFDGRFFVKVYKDEELEDILQSSNVETNYAIAASFGLRYINNNGYANAGTHQNSFGSTGRPEVPLAAVEYPVGNGGQSGSDSISSQDQTGNPNFEAVEYTHSSSSDAPQHPTEHDWSDLANYDSDEHGTYYWGGNTSASGNEEAFGLSAADVQQSPTRALNGRNNDARKFWIAFKAKKQFFIDACTAWSWTGENDDRPGSMFATDLWSSGPTAEDGDNDQASSANYDGADISGNILDEKGQPSRGIWNNGKHMDISWSGMGTESPSPNEDQDYHVELSKMAGEDDTDVYDVAWPFIRALCTTGTKFKFGDDPDETVYTVSDYKNYSSGGITYGWNSQAIEDAIYYPGTDKYTGVFGIRNHGHSGSDDQWKGHNLRQRWTIVVDPPIGSQGVGYTPIHGVNPDMMNTGTGSNAGTGDPSFRRALKHDGSEMTTIQILAPLGDDGSNHYSDNPAVWETEPKESVDIDIYYQASELIPLKLNEKTNEEYIPIGSTFTTQFYGTGGGGNSLNPQTHTVTGWSTGDTMTFTPAIGNITSSNPASANSLANGDKLTFTKPNGRILTAYIKSGVAESALSLVLEGGDTTFDVEKILATQEHTLNWNNCWCFGNGVESDRIRDDFNAPQMDNGVKASTVLDTSIRSERRKHGLIWSGIYNSASSINETNQFIAAEKITKDINPVYGSIQKLYNRNTRLIIFCEDKVLRGVTNRDALYNADGSPQLVASNSVVGDVTAYQGNYGISTNPESCVATPYQVYFTDAMRGHVLALSGEGIRSISNIGMKDYFSRQFDYSDKVLGTYDARKNEYNVSIYKKYDVSQASYHDQVTISYSENAQGWTSFKSFYPTSGVSLNNNYYTFFNGHLWKHHDNETRNNFYGTQYTSTMKLLFNEKPEAIKSFQTINYEGSQARITNFDTESTSSWLTGDYSSGNGLTTNSSITDGEYYNIEATNTGWYVNSILTNLQSGDVLNFKEKESKWFGQVRGDDTNLGNLDLNEFSVQGLGTATIAHDNPSLEETITFPVKNNTGSTWDSTPD